jgi:hypothetical protein
MLVASALSSAVESSLSLSLSLSHLLQLWAAEVVMRVAWPPVSAVGFAALRGGVW